MISSTALRSDDVFGATVPFRSDGADLAGRRDDRGTNGSGDTFTGPVLLRVVSGILRSSGPGPGPGEGNASTPAAAAPTTPAAAASRHQRPNGAAINAATPPPLINRSFGRRRFRFGFSSRSSASTSALSFATSVRKAASSSRSCLSSPTLSLTYLNVNLTVRVR